MRGPESELNVGLDLQDERASANGYSIVFMRQAYPNMALMTYDDEHHQGDHHVLLCKMVVGIGEDKKILSYESCDESTTADNVPGGLISRAVMDGHNVTCELYPIRLPEEDRLRGGAVLHIISEIPGIFLRFGSGGLAFMHFSPNEHIRGQHIDCENGSATLAEDGSAVIIRREGCSEGSRVVTCVKSDMTFTVHDGEKGGSFAEGYTPKSEAWIMLGFSNDGEEAVNLASLDPAAELGRVKEFYRKKFENLYVKTPDENLNEAFTHAYLNLEYAWLYPLGWIESIQHWPTMWHMEQTAAEEWCGNAERTRRTLLTQMEYLFDSGAVPDMCVNHVGRRDWGGNNHFFFREVLHYLRMTNDRDFALTVEPVMEKILSQTLREYDATGTGVLSWHSQIGNQEDMESTPGRGAATGSEGAQMLKLLSELYGYLGNEEKSARYALASAYMWKQVKDTVWRRDLGRMAWFVDDHGQTRLDTTYHGICYPIIYGQVDSFDGMSSADHLLHRMSGVEGEVYQSNHFGDHAYWGVPTWGMQAGSDMQPFATSAYAKLGMTEEAYRPLKFVADRVCGPFQRGAFPETANEKRFAYFSPSAGVYAKEMIESVFGVTRDRIQGVTTVSPCFPKAWPAAELRLPDLSLTYTRGEKQGSTETHALALTSPDGLKKRLLWRIPHAVHPNVTVNGTAVPAEIAYKCGFCELTAELGCGDELTVTVTYDTLNVTVEHPKTAACGEYVPVQVTGGELLGIEDPCGIFDGRGKLRPDLLDEYLPYGDFGLVNFARHTFAVRVDRQGVEVTYPCTVTVLPRQRITAVYDPDAAAVKVTYRNNTAVSIDTPACLASGGTVSAALLVCPPYGTMTVDFPFAGTPVTGKNRAHLLAGDAYSGEIAFDAPATGRVTLLQTDSALSIPYAAWRDMAYPSHHGCIVINPDAFLQGVAESVTVGSLTFPMNGSFIPVDIHSHRVTEIPLNLDARKLFVLFCPFAANHEICTHLFDLEVECRKDDAYMKPLYTYPLTLPGELDYGFGNTVVAGFSTYQEGFARPSVLPPVVNGDYADTLAPLYPSRDLWCRNLAAESGNAVFNLLELDLGKIQHIETLRLIARAMDAAGGVFGIAYE